jgi:hypothetical protein
VPEPVPDGCRVRVTAIFNLFIYRAASHHHHHHRPSQRDLTPQQTNFDHRRTPLAAIVLDSLNSDGDTYTGDRHQLASPLRKPSNSMLKAPNVAPAWITRDNWTMYLAT